MLVSVYEKFSNFSIDIFLKDVVYRMKSDNQGVLMRFLCGNSVFSNQIETKDVGKFNYINMVTRMKFSITIAIGFFFFFLQLFFSQFSSLQNNYNKFFIFLIAVF